ncbi:AraC family transcriptional regulator [Anaerobacillus sp. CMMVII]|uniref:AraC family transcriptional regulator n=1 Tax=Anaerobacillus sp. CMMVII TaxID=2755588 RepID=UPI0021B80079|nr:AraC family transcriptional regulator [Anaerobacillus sp. CMMVII]MCT8139950.1 AraC family transcriptional regulator [Anaerobacillus sp. CMMVII]
MSGESVVTPYGSYRISSLFKENEQSQISSIYVVGWENRETVDYYWDGLHRNDTGTYVFQYTLSGSGILEYDNIKYRLKSGEAFIVDIPSSHTYYLPDDSERWEFVYITLQGQEALKCWRYLRELLGPVFQIQADSELIQLLMRIYRDVAERKVSDIYISSAKAYEFIMECYRFGKSKALAINELPEAISKGVFYIRTHYEKQISVEDIAEYVGFSKYYFIKKFKEHMHMPPLQYLTKTRMEQAFRLLTQTELPIKEIAEKVGYTDANYFHKVFKKAVGISAGQFRENRSKIPFEHLLIE